MAKDAMLAAKESKEICYALYENSFIFSRPIAKTNDFAPARTFYFYSHKIPELVNKMLDLTVDVSASRPLLSFAVHAEPGLPPRVRGGAERGAAGDGGEDGHHHL